MGQAMRLFSILGAVALTTAAVRSASAEVVLNEVLYDPEGADSGKEFVELANSGPFAVTLDGLELEAGNGIGPNEWDLIWSGSADSAIPPGGVYRIGLAAPGPGEEAQLRLQNGPDGVRLLKRGFELDRLGWGEHLHAEYYEKSPAPQVRSGRSLARKVDGLDRDDNANDFEEAIPTPGRANRPLVDWAIQWLRPSPEVPHEGETVLARFRLWNRGRGGMIPPTVELVTPGRSFLVGWVDTVGPGVSTTKVLPLPSPATSGRMVWYAGLLGGDEVPENDQDSLQVLVGEGPVRITEILAAPLPGEPEWVEIQLGAPDGERFEQLVLDVRGRQVRLAPRSSGPKTRLGIVVEDSTALLAAYPDLDPEIVWSHEGGWPRLRNGSRGDAVSDTLRILSGDRCVLEVALPGPTPGEGISLERIESGIPEGPSAWVPCSDPRRSTPGRFGPANGLTIGDDPLRVRPRVLRPGMRDCVIEGSVGRTPGEVALRIVDLQGRSIRSLMEGVWVAGPLVAAWDGRDESGAIVRPGVYFAVMEVVRADKGRDAWRAALAVAPSEGR